MNKIFKASIFAVAALATVSLTSCSDDDDDKMPRILITTQKMLRHGVTMQ